jgi:hypothetical protein
MSVRDSWGEQLGGGHQVSHTFACGDNEADAFRAETLIGADYPAASIGPPIDPISLREIAPV